MNRDTEVRGWLIWSHEHNAWWRDGRNGYTGYLWEAGLYTCAEAMEIVSDANVTGEQNESAVPVWAMGKQIPSMVEGALRLKYTASQFPSPPWNWHLLNGPGIKSQGTTEEQLAAIRMERALLLQRLNVLNVEETVLAEQTILAVVKRREPETVTVPSPTVPAGADPYTREVP